MKKKDKKLGLVFGAGIGLSVGILTGNIAIGLTLGAGVGLIFGTVIKNHNEKIY
ncbi:glycine zipper domain-containing protein [Aquimarina sp. AD1]|uniref:glycine zipper domain-containing protein n=1 Tax=Aquimarina sp. (strain AD1) TaxID=1714848 RepID=UPI0013C2B433|nr:glycine zipper domain-containing protein [Aquimarina sp. AD1]